MDPGRDETWGGEGTSDPTPSMHSPFPFPSRVRRADPAAGLAAHPPGETILVGRGTGLSLSGREASPRLTKEPERFTIRGVSRPVRRVGAFLALSGLTGMSALAGVTALHVILEHQDHHVTVAHAQGEDVRTTKGHPHLHESGIGFLGHSHRGPHDLHRAEAPEHDHVLLLAADLQRRSDRLGATGFDPGQADATPGPLLGIAPPPLSPPGRAGPAARAAPLSRRSVVLQV
jgi:hypothetical protein